MRRRVRQQRVRQLIARQAAELMYREGVSEYFTAKHIAARRVLKADARSVRFRPHSLPTNGEIQAALRELADWAEGATRERRQFAMRMVAMEILEELHVWDACLIGSVATGHARAGSDIDIHVFGDVEAVELDVWRRGWAFERVDTDIRTSAGVQTFCHLHVVDRPFPVELSVYEPGLRRVRTRSSTDGRPIERVRPAALQSLIRTEHTDAYEEWTHTGRLDLDGLQDGPRPVFDGLLRELNEAAPMG